MHGLYQCVILFCFQAHWFVAEPSVINIIQHLTILRLLNASMQVKPEETELVRRDYCANGGWETFLAYEDPKQDILVGLLRLRKVSGSPKGRQPELKGRCSIVRELHVYGTAVAVSTRDVNKQQHQVTTGCTCLEHWPGSAVACLLGSPSCLGCLC